MQSMQLFGARASLWAVVLWLGRIVPAACAPLRHVGNQQPATMFKVDATAESIPTSIAAPLNLTNLTAEQLNKCVTYTGGTCVLSNCDAELGATTCHYGRCHCSAGCAAADGKCYAGTYAVDVPRLSFGNVRWPNHTMHSYGIKLSMEDVSIGTGNFTLLALPGIAATFLLTASDEPEYTMHVSCVGNQFLQVADRADKKYCNYDGKMTPFHKMQGDLSPTTLALRLWSVPDHPGAVMIESFQYEGVFLYAGSGSWTVPGNSGDPGTPGYWFPNPSLDFLNLPPFAGERCQYNCGGDSSDNITSRAQDLFR